MSLTAKEQAVDREYKRVIRRRISRNSPIWPSLSTRINSNSNGETYSWLQSVPKMKEFIGDRIFESVGSVKYYVENLLWEQSLEIPRIVLEDDTYGLFSPLVEDTVAEGLDHPDQLLFERMAIAESELCYDGQYFYDTDHQEGDSGVQSNLLTSEVVDNTNVTVLDMKNAFREALKQMKRFKTDKGGFWVRPRIQMIPEQQLTILVPTELEDVAKDAFTPGVLVNDGSGTSTTNIVRQKATVLASPYMGSENGGSDTMLDLLYTGGVLRPFIFQDRRPMSSEVKFPGLEEKYIKVMTEARYNFGYGLWQYAIRTKFTNA